MQLGLIGCGQIARRVHLPNAARLGLSWAALADPEAAAMDQAALYAPLARRYQDWRELPTDPQVQAVLICSPPSLHAEQALACLDAGKPVFLEKPLSSNGSEALRIVAAAENGRLPVMVGFNLRFHPLTQQLRENWPRLGLLRCIRSVFTAGCDLGSSWRAQAGPLLELACHHLDLTRYLTAQSAELVHLEQSGLHAQVLLRFGEQVMFDGYYSLDSASDEQFQVYGSRGRLSLQRSVSLEVEWQPRLSEGSRWRRLAALLRLPQQLHYLWRQQRAAGFDPSYEACLKHFAEVCRGAPLGPGASARDGWEAIRYFVPPS